MRKDVLIAGVFCVIISIFLMTIFPNQTTYIPKVYSASWTDLFKIGSGEHGIPLSLSSGDYVYVDVDICGGNNDINFYIISPSGNHVRAPSRVYSHYTYNFTATEEGTYQLWFDNSFSNFTPKYVNVELTWKHRELVPMTVTNSFYVAGLLFLVVGILLAAIGAYLKPKPKQ